MARVVRRFISSHAKRCNQHSAAFVFCIYIYTHEYMHYTRFARSPVGEVSHALRGRFPYNVLGGSSWAVFRFWGTPCLSAPSSNHERIQNGWRQGGAFNTQFDLRYMLTNEPLQIPSRFPKGGPPRFPTRKTKPSIRPSVSKNRINTYHDHNHDHQQSSSS